MSIASPTLLERLVRGDRFIYYFTLADAVIADFEEIWFTLRKTAPPSTETTDALAAAQAIMVGTTQSPIAGTITVVSPTVGRVYFPSSATTQLEARIYKGGLQGRRTGETDIETLDFVRLPVLADYGRSS